MKLNILEGTLISDASKESLEQVFCEIRGKTIKKEKCEKVVKKNLVENCQLKKMELVTDPLLTN